MHLISFNREFFREFFCDLSVCYSVDSVILYIYLNNFQIHRFNHVCKCHCRKVILSKHKQSKQGKQGEYLLYANLYMHFFCFIGSKASPLENSQKAKYGYLLSLGSILSKGLHLPRKTIKTHGQLNFTSIHSPCHVIRQWSVFSKKKKKLATSYI